MDIKDISNNHTLIHFTKPSNFNNINLSDKIICIGSCFADEMAKRLKSVFFDVTVNPFGTIYNAASIYNELNIIFNRDFFEKSDLLNYKNTFISLDHATCFDDSNYQNALNKINQNIEKNYLKFIRANTFILTYGTSVIWSYQDKIVANCHKINQNMFSQRLLSAEENQEYITKAIRLIKSFYPDAKIIITLSPIRHKNPDLLTNSYSKALLNVAIHEAINKFDNIMYFPSYEIVLDQLRDYTFFKTDGVHLKKIAIDFIYSIFAECLFEDKTKQTIKKIQKVLATFSHKTKEINQTYFNNLVNVYNCINEIKKDFTTNCLDKFQQKVIKKMIKNFYNNEHILNQIKNLEVYKQNQTKFEKIIQKRYK